MVASLLFETCTSDSAPTVYPSDDDDMCPLPPPDEDETEQPESCNLVCNKERECHSHNIFGGCTYLLEWITPEPMFGDALVNHVIIFQGDTIRFSTKGNMSHNLYE